MRLKNFYKIILFINYVIFCRFSHTNGMVFNISDFTGDNILHRTFQKSGPLTVGTYIPEIANNVTKVMDSASTIWTSNNIHEIMTLIRTYSMYGKLMLLYIYVVAIEGSYSKYYEKRNYNWFEISGYDFDVKMFELRKRRILDLSEPDDNETFYKENINLGGLPSSIYIPYERYDVVSVHDDFDIIWEGFYPFDKCTSITVHGHPGNYKLLHLNLKISGGRDEIYFRKNGSEWIECTKEYFYEMLEILDSEERNRSTSVN